MVILTSCFASKVGVFAKTCYRCQKAQTFSNNFTLSLFPLTGSNQPCFLEKIRCTKHEHSCIYGLVSVVVSGGFWFHLSGCYILPVATNESRCYRGSGPVQWPAGLKAEFRADYCLCAGDFCNDRKFDESVVSYSLSRTGSEAMEEPMPNTSSSPTHYHQTLKDGESRVIALDVSSSSEKRNLSLVVFLAASVVRSSLKWTLL